MNRNTVERRLKLKNILLTSGSVNSADASMMFSVSTETIRKDLLFLEKQGFAKKNHGGAIASTDYIETPFDLRNDKNVDLKIKVAKKALEYVPEKGVILLDAGSTILMLAKELLSRENLTIITNSMSVCNMLLPSSNNVYITGGLVKNVTMSLVGLWANSCLSSINIDIAFLGTSGFMNFTGPSSESFQEAEIKKKILERSNVSIVLTDSSKCKLNALAQFALWNEINYLIMDNPPELDRIEQIQQSTNVILI
ncbi:MAG: DeoR/GlpR family DNA-binding transcription regulator [Synergistaceae bacterium]|jgi:DeoR/GlpR family transcriptional regulator of sugar metabolism|nr:DeoR/GlpR family DNA-binding transcription regulator [Synergistaceae bacterium]